MKPNQQELKAAIEQATRDKLRQHGLSHLSINVRLKSGDDFEVDFEGASPADEARARAALGVGSPTEILPGDIGRIDPAIDIDRMPSRSRRPKSK